MTHGTGTFEYRGFRIRIERRNDLHHATVEEIGNESEPFTTQPLPVLNAYEARLDAERFIDETIAQNQTPAGRSN